jgi:hypothetical protein
MRYADQLNASSNSCASVSLANSTSKRSTRICLNSAGWIPLWSNQLRMRTIASARDWSGAFRRLTTPGVLMVTWRSFAVRSVAQHALQQDGLIAYARGMLTILDRPGPEEVASQCYDVIRERFDRFLT